MVISDGFQIPIHSMISEVHNTSVVSFWLREFVRLTGDVPDVFVSDMSKVLLNSAAREFANCPSIADYADILFNMHFGSTQKIPSCCIRIDKNHFIKHVASCAALRDSSKLQREFYIRCVYLLMQSTNIKQAEFILLATLTVAKCEFQGKKYFLRTFLSYFNLMFIIKP